MPGLLPHALRREAWDPSFLLFLAAVALCLVPARELPAAAFDLAGTSLALTPADVALATLAVVATVLVVRGRVRPARPLLAAAAVFALVVGLSALANGAAAVVSAGKLLELAALTLGGAALLGSPPRLRLLVIVLVVVATIASLWAAVGFLGAGGGRQASFLGEHDLSLLSTLTIAVGLARIHSTGVGPLAATALAAGVVGTILGASLAGLLGVAIAAAVIVAIAMRRRELRVPALAATLAVVVVTAAGTLSLRQGDLGFIQAWFGPAAETPGEYSASWSQRLIYAYVGARVFADNPVLGTGWEGEIPPADFAEYVPDARARYPDEPPHYFPPTDRDLIPQQAYDQILYQLGLVGAAAFLAVGLLAVRRAVAATAARAPDAAYLPAAWLACVASALAAAALFGGSPLTALFWLTLGVLAVKPDETA